MLELPEAITLGKQKQQSLTGKIVRRVLPPTKSHKFTWFAGDPADYDARLRGCGVSGSAAYGCLICQPIE